MYLTFLVSSYSTNVISFLFDQAVFTKIRSSKFRHVHEVCWRKELCYDNIKITKNANDSQFCAVNPKFLAIVTETGMSFEKN